MKLKAKKLNEGDFAKFGTFLDPHSIKTKCLGDKKELLFYPDSLTFCFSAGTLISLSTIVIQKRPMVENNMEYHDFTEEIIGGFTDDVVFFAGLPSKEPDLSKFEAFILPRSNWVRVKRGIWHYGQFPINNNDVLGWCLLPPFTYQNDSILFRSQDPIEISIS
jgi:ureidoglycolate hydrolase